MDDIKIQKQLKTIQETFETIKNSGLDRDILIAFLKDRTGMGKSQIIEVLEAEEDFFKKLSSVAIRPKED